MTRLFTSALSAALLPLLASCGVATHSPPAQPLPELRDAVTYSDAHGKSITEGTRSLTGRILIPPPTGDTTVRIIPSPPAEITATWPGWDEAMFIGSHSQGDQLESQPYRDHLWQQAVSSIDPTREYQIDLLTRTSTTSATVHHEILHISRNGRTILDASICNVHHRPMRRQIENIASADSYPDPFFRRRKNQFPYDGIVYLGSGGASLTPLWQCPTCARLQAAWRQKNAIKE